jgi:hypothetical protein
LFIVFNFDTCNIISIYPFIFIFIFTEWKTVRAMRQATRVLATLRRVTIVEVEEVTSLTPDIKGWDGWGRGSEEEE